MKNILLFIGNGFDINLGLSTKYIDFYNYYKDKPSSNQLVQCLKKDIGDYVKKAHEEKIKKQNETKLNEIDWADLEVGLGQYTERLQSYEELKTVYYDLDDSLMEYLKMEEEDFFKNIQGGDMSLDERVVGLNRVLTSGESDTTGGLLIGDECEIDVITLNYTKVFDRLMHFEKLGSKFIGAVNGYNYFLHGVHHVHGDINDEHDLILGVNDVSQIGNLKFKESIDAMDILLKPQRNNSIDTGRNKLYTKLINAADMIVTFGVSFGITDNKWWSAIKDRLDSRLCFLLCLSHGDYIAQRDTDKSREERKIKAELLERLGYDENSCKMISNNVFVRYNNDIFDIKVLKRTLTKK